MVVVAHGIAEGFDVGFKGLEGAYLGGLNDAYRFFRLCGKEMKRARMNADFCEEIGCETL